HRRILRRTQRCPLYWTALRDTTGVVAKIRTKRVVKKAAPPKRRRVIRRLDNDERKAQLLAMGRAAFASSPYDAVSIDELAKKAKISKGLFYYYFPTKRDLYIAGLSETSKEL